MYKLGEEHAQSLCLTFNMPTSLKHLWLNSYLWDYTFHNLLEERWRSSPHSPPLVWHALDPVTSGAWSHILGHHFAPSAAPRQHRMQPAFLFSLFLLWPSMMPHSLMPPVILKTMFLRILCWPFLLLPPLPTHPVDDGVPWSLFFSLYSLPRWTHPFTWIKIQVLCQHSSLCL